MPLDSDERYCIYDGAEMLTECRHCRHPVTSPYARFCPECGRRYDVGLD